MEDELNRGKLWPEPLIQFNPASAFTPSTCLPSGMFWTARGQKQVRPVVEFLGQMRILGESKRIQVCL